MAKIKSELRALPGTLLSRFFLLAVLTTGGANSTLQGVARAEEQGVTRVASLTVTQGLVEFRTSESASWQIATQGLNLHEGDFIRTGESSRAGLKFNAGYSIRLGEKTHLKVEKKQDASQEQPIHLDEGRAFFFSRTPQVFPKVVTPQVSASVRGTEFVVVALAGTSKVIVLDGGVDVADVNSKMALSSGEQAEATLGKPLKRSRLMNVENAVQWAVSFPRLLQPEDIPGLLISEAELQKQSSGSDGFDSERILHYLAKENLDWRTTVAKAMLLESTGDLVGALQTVEISASSCPSACLLYRGALELRVGKVDAAEQSLGLSIEKSSPLSAPEKSVLQSASLALHSLIALSSGRKEEAAGLLETAIEYNEYSPSVRLSQSYFLQAGGRHDSALEGLEKLPAPLKTSGSLSLRRAELLFSQGKKDEALELLSALSESAAQDPSAKALKGFIKLASQDTDGAVVEFNGAIASDPSVGLYHLGMGLAQIKQGDLDGGKRSLETAVLVDPNISLYRSYLGKSFFEQENSISARHEYDRAMKLDPLDPTPYMYRSFLSLSEHRPVEALEDITEAVRLNDNRAIFRSRLLLDQDLGSRTASMGRIYSSLGFKELARLAANEALTKDYANYSGHYLLSESYQDAHLTSRTRTTENLIGRLLSPSTFNSSAIENTQGAGSNEYSSLFDRPGTRTYFKGGLDTQTESLAGGARQAVSGENWGTMFGYTNTSRDGTDDADFQRFQEVFAQGQYSWGGVGNIILDVAGVKDHRGDLVFNNNIDLIDPDYDSDLRSGIIRLAYRHQLSPNTQLIAHSFFESGKQDVFNLLDNSRIRHLFVSADGHPVRDKPFDLDSLTNEELEIDANNARAEAQIISQHELVSVVAGFSGDLHDTDSSEDGVISDPGSVSSTDFLRGFKLYSNATQENLGGHLYGYATVHALPELDLTSGLSYSRVELSQNDINAPFVDEGIDKDQLSPKFGFSAKVLPDLHLRGAYTRSFDNAARGGVGRLEPTFVGGFNQLYDGLKGQESELSSVGIDYAFGGKTFLGGSYQLRNVELDIPFYEGGVAYDRETLALNEQNFLVTDRQEADIERADVYFYQVLSSSLVFSIDYAWELFEEDSYLTDTSTVKTVPSLKFFHPSGFFASISPAWRYQEWGGEANSPATNSFVTLDAGLGYELDNRHGRIRLEFKNILDQEMEYYPITDEALIWPQAGVLLFADFNF